MILKLQLLILLTVLGTALLFTRLKSEDSYGPQKMNQLVDFLQHETEIWSFDFKYLKNKKKLFDELQKQGHTQYLK